jgi:hypothetical protein
LAKPPWIEDNGDKDKHRSRPIKKLEQRIIIILGVDAMRNPDTNTSGSITSLQISKQVPDLILRSFDDIKKTMLKQNYY